MNTSKLIALFLLSFYSLTLFSQKKYDPIKINVDKINPVYAIIERTSDKGTSKEKVFKKDTARIQQIQADETLKFIDFEFVNIDQVVTYWVKKQADRHCCMGPENCKVWALAEMNLVYTDSIYLYKKEDLTSSDSEIFPNPVIDFLNVSTNSEISAVRIFDFWGREVIQDHTSSKNKTIDVGHLVSGAYTIQLKFENKIETHKFIKK